VEPFRKVLSSYYHRLSLASQCKQGKDFVFERMAMLTKN